MEGQRPGGFPLLVRGDWGSAEPPPALRRKLLCYFQSQKSSGGGECELRAGTGTGTGTGHLLVCFAHPEAKQRVLERQSHELYLGEKVKLVVTEPDTALAKEEEASEEKLSPTKFVAQPNCQQLLASRWYDEFPGWRRRHWAVKMLTCVVIGLLFPVFSVCYLIAPKSPLGLFIRKPFIKFICHTASYLTFLFLLLLASQHIDRSDLSMQGPPPTIVEWMILPWVLGKCITIENTVKSVLTPVVLPSIPEAGRHSREFYHELLSYQNRQIVHLLQYLAKVVDNLGRLQ